MIRKIVFYENYFEDFYTSQSKQVQEKIDFVLNLISNVEVIPSKFLKYLEGTDGMYEVRIKVGSNIYRIFCFFDQGKLIILINGFHKKDQKTPKNEIVKAEKIKKAYFDDKQKGRL